MTYPEKLKSLGLTQIEGIYRMAAKKSGAELKRYTGYISWDEDGDEEIDVDAEDSKSAKEVVKLALMADFQPGWKKIKMSPVRVGLYI